jgi:hypothetical protein
MAMSKLDAVNAMLGLLAQLRVNSLDDDNEFVSGAVFSLNMANTREQQKGWWFNRELVEIAPDTSGFIRIPDDCLSADPVNGSQHYVVRGRKLYKPYDRATATKYTFTAPVVLKLTREVPFEECPPEAQTLILASAKLEFGENYEVDQTKAAILDRNYKLAMIQCGKRELSSMNLNRLARPNIAEFDTIGSNLANASIAGYIPHG